MSYGDAYLARVNGIDVLKYSINGDVASLGNAGTLVSLDNTGKLASSLLPGGTGGMTFKGTIDCSGSPNYPAAVSGDTYVVSVAGKIGGSAGVVVEAGDLVLCTVDNVGGTQAAVGTSWDVLNYNIVGPLLSANNLSDVASAGTSRTNLGLGSLATQNGTFSGTSSGVNTGDQDLTGLLVKSANLSDLINASTARGNLGLTAIATIISGTGVNSALAINIGTAGAFVTFNGAGGTPSSLVGTNITGTAAGFTVGNATLAATVTTNANLTGVITSVGNATSIASQTGTGSVFVVATSPTLVTPILGVAAGTNLTLSGVAVNTVVFAGSGHSLTGSSTVSGYTHSSTLNTSGATFDVTQFKTTVTAVGSGVNLLNVLGGAGGVTSYFSIGSAGASAIPVSLAIGGATIGTNALAVMGTVNVSGDITGGAKVIATGGSSALPSFTFVGSNTTGIYDASNSLGFAVVGVSLATLDSTANGLRLGSGTKFGWASTSAANGNSVDTIIGRGGAAATLQHGAADAASPVAQTIKFQDVVAGTSNTAGVNATIQASAGTGTGIGGSLIFQVAAAGTTGTAKNAWSTGLTVAPTGVSFLGTTTNNNAAAGNVGEVISSTIVQGSAVVLTTVTQANVTSISLSAGDWDVWFEALFDCGATTTVSVVQSSVSQTSAGRDLNPGNIYTLNYPASVLGATTLSCTAGPSRQSLAVTTTIYGVVLSVFGVSTMNAYGILRARRVR